MSNSRPAKVSAAASSSALSREVWAAAEESQWASEKPPPWVIFFLFSYFSEIEMHVKLYGLYLSCDRFFE